MIMENSFDHAVSSAQGPRASPRTVLTITTHH